MCNISTTQAEVVAHCWELAERGFDTLTGATMNATDLITVREAMEANDEHFARCLAQRE